MISLKGILTSFRELNVNKYSLIKDYLMNKILIEEKSNWLLVLRPGFLVFLFAVSFFASD